MILLGIPIDDELLNTSNNTDKLMGISISSTHVKFIANTMFLLILIELSALLLFFAKTLLETI